MKVISADKLIQELEEVRTRLILRGQLGAEHIIVEEVYPIIENAEAIDLSKPGCLYCDYRKFSSKICDGIVQVMNEYNLESVDDLVKILKGGVTN